jgi:hypothetical protein
LLRDFFIAGKFCFHAAVTLAGDADGEGDVLPSSISIICVNYFNIFRQYLKRPALVAITFFPHALRIGATRHTVGGGVAPPLRIFRHSNQRQYS